MVTVVLSITLAADDVTALANVQKQLKKIHQIIRYNEVFHFISLFFTWIKVAVVGGSLYGPCDCMCVHCGQSCRSFLLTLEFMLPVQQMFHHGGITGNAPLPQYMRVYPKYSGLVPPSIQQL
jgi:hypothetical protein